LEEQATFIRSGVLDALSRLEREKPFDLIFLDPPYGKGLVQKVVAALADSEFLAPEGIICAESARKDDIPEAIDGLVCIEKRSYGSTTVHLFAYPEQEAEVR
jgi:16S rRNA G966 N2-methylase RsmD